MKVQVQSNNQNLPEVIQHKQNCRDESCSLDIAVQKAIVNLKKEGKLVLSFGVMDGRLRFYDKANGYTYTIMHGSFKEKFEEAAVRAGLKLDKKCEYQENPYFDMKHDLSTVTYKI